MEVLTFGWHTVENCDFPNVFRICSLTTMNVFFIDLAHISETVPCWVVTSQSQRSLHVGLVLELSNLGGKQGTPSCSDVQPPSSHPPVIFDNVLTLHL